MTEIKYIEGHECIKTPDDIGIEKYQTDKLQWYFRTGKQLNAIIYCPYCGKKLEG